MNKSTIRKLKVVLTNMGTKNRVIMGVRCLALFVVLMFAALSSLTFAQSPYPHRINVEILDIRNNNGSIACGLFESPEGFPTEYLRCATNIMITKVRDKKVSFDFHDIPPGTYAIVIVHDENVNGKLDTNWLGVPKEGYGFSNGAKGFLRAPSFNAASFTYDGRNLNLTIRLRY